MRPREHELLFFLAPMPGYFFILFIFLNFTLWYFYNDNVLNKPTILFSSFLPLEIHFFTSCYLPLFLLHILLSSSLFFLLQSVVFNREGGDETLPLPSFPPIGEREREKSKFDLGLQPGCSSKSCLFARYEVREKEE